MSDQYFINWAKEKLNQEIETSKEDHGDQSRVYKIKTPRGNYFLKIGSRLEKEHERLEWLNGKLPVPEIVSYTNFENKDAMLMTAIKGKNLADLCKEWPAEKVVDRLAQALRQFHAVDAKNCPFGIFAAGKVLVHGDACLPNFIFDGDVFSGYVDLGDVAVDNPQIDLAAAIWSLQYNLGPGYGAEFLKKYGLKNVTEELIEKLRLQYEDMQKKWGLL